MTICLEVITMDYRELVLFAIAIFGCVFGIYQWVKKGSREEVIDAKTVVKEAAQLETTVAAQNTLLMNELKHISENVTEIRTDVKILSSERNKDREDILVLGEHHKNLSDKLNTAFEKIDQIRDGSVTRQEFEDLKQDVNTLLER